MHHMRSVLILGLALSLALSTVAAAEIETRDRLGTRHYETFDFHEGTSARRAAAQQRIESSIEGELRAKGLLRVAGEAELRVVTHVLVDRHTIEKLDERDYFEYWTGVDAVDAFDLRAGTLVVDLIDAEQQRVVWRGVASSEVKGGSEKALRLIDKIVRKLFKRFPER
jgi:hypothetical protein